MEDANDEIDNLVEDIYNNYNNKRVSEAFKILNKLFNNIINNPDEEKYKIFKKSNINLQLKVLIIKECQDILKSLGYTELDEDRLIFKGNINRLKYATYVMTKKIFKIEEILEKQRKEEEEEKQEKIRKEFEEKSKMLMEEKMERERLKQQCLNDRKEVAQNMKPKNSVANNLKFGAKEVKVEFTCSGGGGR
jgi:hypothetical protein